MKTFRTITMMVALTVIANIAMASGNLRVNILPLKADRAVVAISNNAESKFQISIEDEHGAVVYFKETDEGMADYRKVYDFSNLENGSYKLVVSLDNISGEREFSIDHGVINVGKENFGCSIFLLQRRHLACCLPEPPRRENKLVHLHQRGTCLQQSIGKFFLCKRRT